MQVFHAYLDKCEDWTQQWKYLSFTVLMNYHTELDHHVFPASLVNSYL